jgi:hypothetical protein
MAQARRGVGSARERSNSSANAPNRSYVKPVARASTACAKRLHSTHFGRTSPAVIYDEEKQALPGSILESVHGAACRRTSARTTGRWGRLDLERQDRHGDALSRGSHGRARFFRPGGRVAAPRMPRTGLVTAASRRLRTRRVWLAAFRPCPPSHRPAFTCPSGSPGHFLLEKLPCCS